LELQDGHSAQCLTNSRTTGRHLAGINPKAVSARLGHASISITLDTFGHIIPEIESQASAAIGRALLALARLVVVSLILE
jgi:hypothetical protein